MIFRQLFDTDSSTYTYLLADDCSREAVLIDPVQEHAEVYLDLLKQLELSLKYSLETHVHADHITASGIIRKKTGCQIVEGHESKAKGVDILIKENDTLKFGSQVIHAIHTPGHTPCSMTYRIDNMIFTGDALLISGCGRTDFQGGSAKQLWHSITQKLFTLPPDTLVYPGHDYKKMRVSTIAQEMDLNPRFHGKTETDFVELMQNLKLDPPRRIQEAVPANIKLGLD